MPASFNLACATCGTFLPWHWLSPILVGDTPIRSANDRTAGFCDECLKRYRDAPLLDLFRAMEAQRDTVRETAAAYFGGTALARLGDDATRRIAHVQVGSVAAALRLRALS